MSKSESSKSKAPSREPLSFDPFSASEEEIAEVNPDIVFRLNPFGNSLRAHSQFRPGLKRRLEAVSGVHYVRAEKSFYFPVHALTPFLKKLRDDGVPFAVEESAGKILKSGAILRKEIAVDNRPARGSDFSKSLLVPFIELLGNREAPLFSIQAWTTEQLRQLTPWIKEFAERKRLAESITEADLTRILFHAKKSVTTLWLSNEVRSFLESRRPVYETWCKDAKQGFPEEFISVTKFPCVWGCDAHGKMVLLIRKEELRKKRKALGPLFVSSKEVAYPENSDYAAFPISLGTLSDIEAALSENWSEVTPFLKTTSFIDQEKVLEGTRKQLERRRYFHSLSDVTLALFDSHLEKALFPHQRVAVSWLLENSIGILGDDMGLGKTLSLLSAFHELRQQRETDFLLVVCPNSLVRNWLRESARWTKQLNLQALPQVKAEREQFLKNLIRFGTKHIDGLVVNFETARLEYVFPSLVKIAESRKTTLCIDESQRMKNPQSKAFHALKEIAEHCRRRYLLSGTPTPRELSDIWAQMHVLDGGERFGQNYYRWLESVAVLGNKWSKFAVKKYKPHAVEDAVNRIHEVLLRRRKEEVMNLPEKIFSVRDVELTGDQLERYEEVRKELLLRVTNARGDIFTREIQNIMEEYLRAVQIASNPRLVDPNWKGVPAKFVELDHLVHEVVGERGLKIVIWTNYLQNVKELSERYMLYGSAAFSGEVSTEERDRIVSTFQREGDKEVRVLVAIPAAGGVGITLTASQTAVYIDKTWNAEHWLQSIDRIHRIGQKGTVSIISLHGCLVDEFIASNLERKRKVLAEVMGDEKQTIFTQYPTREELLAALKE